MRSSLTLKLIILLFAASAFGENTPSRLLVLGDSISAAYGIERERGWVALLQQQLDADDKAYRVINGSVSGDTTADGLTRLPKLLQDHQPSIVVIELGGNDGLRGFPLKLIEKNLHALIDQSEAAGAKVLLVGMRIPPNYGRRYSEGFHALYAKIAENAQVPLMPFLLEPVATEPKLMQSDGIHPTAEAQPKMLEAFTPYLEPLL